MWVYFRGMPPRVVGAQVVGASVQGGMWHRKGGEPPSGAAALQGVCGGGQGQRLSTAREVREGQPHVGTLWAAERPSPPPGWGASWPGGWGMDAPYASGEEGARSAPHLTPTRHASTRSLMGGQHPRGPSQGGPIGRWPPLLAKHAFGA